MNKEMKQPKQLYLFSISELWERFAYYTMHGILVLYMTSMLGFSDASSYLVFAIFSAILYLVPILGGIVADKVLGAKLSVIVGGLILSAGYAVLALHHGGLLYLGLAIIIVGSGLFMPNISSIVSSLYRKGDSRQDSGFSIFYTAINVGALFPPLIVAVLIHRLGWHAAFSMAALSALLSVVIFFIVCNTEIDLKTKNIKIFSLLILLTILLVFCIDFLIRHSSDASIILFLVGIVFIGFTLFQCSRFEKEVRNRLFACIVLILFSVVFSVLYQQAGSSFTIFAEFNVQRVQGGFHIPTVMFQSLNPLFIILLGPFLAKLWSSLASKKLNPSVPIKFSLGTMLMGLGFAIMPFAIATHSTAWLISPWWIVLSYFLQTLGEMLVSPIGLSMVSQYSPVKITGLMMGVWYFATAVADAIAGYVAKWTILASGSNNPVFTAPKFSHIFGEIGLLAIIVGIIILFLSPLFRKFLVSYAE